MKRKLSKLLGIGLTIALLTSLLITAVPASAMTQPTVSIPFGGNVIGANTTYTITFTAGVAVSANCSIVVTFPAGTGITKIAAADVTVQVLTGIGGGDGTTNPAMLVTPTGAFGAPQVLTIDLAAGKSIGQGSLVGVTVKGVINPNTPATYSLTVATKKGAAPASETATSSNYDIVSPTLTPLPGIVTAFNAAGVQMEQSNSIQTCVNKAGVGGKVEVGPGYYDEDIRVNDRMTIIATGAAGTAIIKNTAAGGGTGTITVNVTGSAAFGGVVIDGLNFQMPAFRIGAPATPVIVLPTTSYATIKNCTIQSGTVSGVNVQAGATFITIDNCTIDATSPTAGTAYCGITAAGQATIKNTKINVGSSTATQAVTSNAGTAGPGASLIQDCTITGSSGKGIAVTGGVITIKKNTLTTLTNALAVTGGTVTVESNTITSCGGTLVDAGSPVTLDRAAGNVTVKLYNNTIKDSSAFYYAVSVGATSVAANVTNLMITAHNNNFLNNPKNLTNAGAYVNFTHNWWGATTGPAADSLGATILPTAYTPFLTSDTSNAGLAMAASQVLAKDTVGVDVTCVDNNGTPQNVGTLAVSKYSKNPETSTPRIAGTGSVKGYYDVYVANPGAATKIQIKFYGAVNSYCKLFYAGGLGGEWTPVGPADNTGINTAGGYAYFVATATSSPSITELTGTPFALVEDKTTDKPNISAIAGGSPVVGAYDVSIEPMFTWGTVPGAIRYEIALSEDPTFTIIEWSYNVDNNFYKVDEALRYDTTYYWRVRGVLGEPYQQAGAWVTPSTPWANGIFTTESEPVVETTPIVVDPVKPQVNVEIPPTKITVEPAGAAIPTYILWIIVIVGVVLVIALIVLIVRTRRVV